MSHPETQLVSMRIRLCRRLTSPGRVLHESSTCSSRRQVDSVRIMTASWSIVYYIDSSTKHDDMSDRLCLPNKAHDRALCDKLINSFKTKIPPRESIELCRGNVFVMSHDSDAVTERCVAYLPLPLGYAMRLSPTSFPTSNYRKRSNFPSRPDLSTVPRLRMPRGIIIYQRDNNMMTCNTKRLSRTYLARQGRCSITANSTRCCPL